MLIYKATNLINNKIYIGKTSKILDHRKYFHIKEALNNRYPNICFHRAIRKYGKDNFVWEILTETGSESKLNILEKFYIAAYRKMAILYNMTDGGDGLTNPSEEIRKRMSNSAIGHTPWNKGKNYQKTI